MNINALITEIKTDPLTRGYANMTNQQLFDSLNSVTRTKLVPIKSDKLLAWAAQNGRYAKILSGTTINLSNQEQTNVCRSICWAAIKMIERDGTELDLNLQDRAALVDALVSFTILSSSDRTNLYNLASVSISRLEEIGCEGIIFEHFSHIRDINR